MGLFGIKLPTLGDVGKAVGSVTNPINSALDQATKGLTSEDVMNTWLNTITAGGLGVENGQIGMGVGTRTLKDAAGAVTNPINSALDQATKGLTSEDVMNAWLNAFTLGGLGVENGQIGKGVGTRALDEGIGELTGRNIARKQAMNAQDALNEQRAAAERERAGRLQQQEQSERQASNRAASMTRRTGTGTNGGIGGSGVEQQMAIDFLGL